MPKVLIIDDEKELAEILGEYLKLEGFDTIIAFDGEEGIQKYMENSPELVILDIMLPKKNGIEVCKAVRAVSDAVIIMLSAKNGEMDKVISLGAGADDYVTKPFSPVELVARVKAHARRYSGGVHSGMVTAAQSSPVTADQCGTAAAAQSSTAAAKNGAVTATAAAQSSAVAAAQSSTAAAAPSSVAAQNGSTNSNDSISAGSLFINKAAYEAKINGMPLDLTTKEFELLVFFASNINRVFSKEQLYEQVWGLNEYGDIGTVAVYIRKLRSKFEMFGHDYIKTIWGVGYKFVEETNSIN